MSEPTIRDVRDQLQYAIAQLRHAYQQLFNHDERWSRRGMHQFADGLLAPQIRKLERLDDLLVVLSAPAAIENTEPLCLECQQRIEPAGYCLTCTATHESALTHKGSAPPAEPLYRKCPDCTGGYVVTEDDEYNCDTCATVGFVPVKAAASPAPAPADPQIECPACGEIVKQVSSATLGLALSQHYTWVCKKAATSAEPQGWQPIATAPKDGRTIRVRQGDLAYVHVFYREGEWKFIEYQHPLARCLTHWMPAAPAGRQEGE